MKTDIKERWVAKLRSGEYEQGAGALHRLNGNGGDQFCCLGVLCEIAVADGVISPSRYEPALDPEEPGKYSYAGSAGLLPAAVERWAGMGGSSWGRLPDGIQIESNDTLAELNDDGKSFTEIADIIEEYF